MIRFSLTLSLFLLLTQTVFSQMYGNVYRPPDQDWHELKTDHFRIIFPLEIQQSAQRAASILEREYPKVQRLVGGRLSNFPIILNYSNDLANGFVTPVNFRSEVELPPVKGKSINPRSGNWLELVLPHELVHALHLNVNPFSLSSIIGLFSPDLRRTIHATAPFGVFEGIAVQHESHGVTSGGGRGNYPYFTNQFSSNFMSEDRWSLGQLYHISSSTLPYNRHYIGGYRFTNWLQNHYGDETVREAIRFNYTWPFLGYGTALRHATGKWPAGLYREFEDEMVAQEQNRLGEIGERTTEESDPIRFWQSGPQLRRPLWLDEQTLVMYGRFYNAPYGFYTYDLSDNHLSLLLESISVEDYRYSYNKEEHSIYFSNYVPSTFYDNTYKADLFRYDLEEGRRIRLTKNKRVYAPSPGPLLLAVHTDQYRGSLVSVNSDNGELSLIAELPLSISIEEVLYNPVYLDSLAVIANRDGIQGLWITDVESLHNDLVGQPDVVFENGSVFDLAWHPEGHKILFSSDYTGILNVYELDLENESLIQVTNSSFNAFEASYSPDGNRIAYIMQEESNTLAYVLDREFFHNRVLPKEVWKHPGEYNQNNDFSFIETADDSLRSGWELDRYRSGIRWLWPRTLIPIYEERFGNGYELGMSFMGTDPLGSQSYSMTVKGIQDRVWFDLGYMNTTFYPGFGLQVFDDPSFPHIGDLDGARNPTRFLLRERGIALNLPFRFILEQGTRLTALMIRPEYRLSQTEFYGLDDSYDGLNGFKFLHSANIHVTFHYRLRQFSRDFQPNSGWSFFGQFDTDLNDIPFQFEHKDFRFHSRIPKRSGLRAGVYTFLTPIKYRNQSLRLGAQVLYQSLFPKFETQNIVSSAFSGDVFGNSDDLAFFDTRYTIPLVYPDQGGLTLPVYLSNMYLVLYSQTVADLNQASPNRVFSTSRTAVGAGLRSRFRISNLTFDMGIGFGFEPSRNQWTLLFGQF